MMTGAVPRVTEAGDLANALVARAAEHRMPMWSGFGLPLQGAVMARRGNGAAATKRSREGLSVLAAMGARYFEPFYLGLLAEALAVGGEVEVGLEVLAEALARGEVSGQKGMMRSCTGSVEICCGNGPSPI